MEIGESIADCARREVQEETGLTIEIAGIVGIYSDPRHVFAYDDGEVRQEFSICFQAQVLEGAVASSEESYEVAFFEPSDISDLEMVDSIRRRISDHLDGDGPAIR